MGLLDAEELPGFNLGQAARFNKAVNVQRQPGFQEFLFWLGKAEVGEDAPARLCAGTASQGSCAFCYPKVLLPAEVINSVPVEDSAFSSWFAYLANNSLRLCAP